MPVMFDRPVGRRAVLRAGVGALAVLGLPGCAASSDGDEATVPRTAGDPVRQTSSTPSVPPGLVPPPTAMVRTSWGADPWTLGSYSYLPVGATPQARVDLGTPVDDRLYFAGEALDTANPATVHGAQASGLTAAA